MKKDLVADSQLAQMMMLALELIALAMGIEDEENFGEIFDDVSEGPEAGTVIYTLAAIHLPTRTKGSIEIVFDVHDDADPRVLRSQLALTYPR